MFSTMLAWGAGFIVVDGLFFVVSAMRGLLPPPWLMYKDLLIEKLLNSFGVTGAIGCAAGVVFAAIVMFAERGRRVDTIPGWRFSGWGALAGAGVFFLLRMAIGDPLDPSLLAWTGVYGLVSALIASAIHSIAKRGTLRSDSVHRAELGSEQVAP